MTETEKKVLRFLAEFPGSTCTEVGEAVFARGNKARHVLRQSYARPAGKVLKRLVALGHVRSEERRIAGTSYSRRVFYVKLAKTDHSGSETELSG